LQKGFLVLIAVAILVIFGGVLVYNFQANQQEKLLREAPNFQAKDVDGNLIRLSDHEGKIVILDFIFFDEGTCDHCYHANIRMFSILQGIKDTYSEDEVAVIIIDMTSDDEAEYMREIRASQGLNMTIINDPWEGASNDRKFDETTIGSRYIDYILTGDDNIANPTILILDQKQFIQYKYQISVFTSGGYGDGDKVTYKSLSEDIDSGLEDDWPDEGIYISPGVQLMGMFVLGIFISITPCAFAIFVSMTTYVLSTKVKASGEDTSKKEKDKGYKQLRRDTEPILARIIKSNEFYGALIGLAFASGMSIVFFLLGIGLSFIGSLIRENAVFFKIFFLFAGVVMIFLGINNLKSIVLIVKDVISKFQKDTEGEGMPRETFFDRTRLKAMGITERSVFLGAFLLGLLMSIGWAPCLLTYVMPVYLMVMTSEMHFMMGGVYLLVMCAGFAVPIIFISSLSMSVKGEASQNLIQIGKAVRILFSLFIILIGIYFIVTTIFPELSITKIIGI